MRVGLSRGGFGPLYTAANLCSRCHVGLLTAVALRNAATLVGVREALYTGG
jgi:hypothetical protein